MDNFSVTYKQLLYRLVVMLVAGTICYFVINPFIQSLLPELDNLLSNAGDYILKLLNGDVLQLTKISDRVKEAYASLMALLEAKTQDIALLISVVLIIYLISAWFNGLGNYATAAVINDKMALRANAPFFGTLIKNLKQAAIYNAIYVPLSFLYDAVVGVAMFFFIFYLVNSIVPILLCVFLFIVVIVLSVAVKLTLTCDWLPTLIRGKLGQKKAIACTFSRKNKNTFNVLSNFVVLTLLVLAINVAALFFTLGVGMLITVPASFVILISFNMINYYDREEIKYFVDKNTIIKPAKERTLTREEFFRGDGD